MREITYREAIKEALKEEMRRDESVFLLGEDLADPMGGSLKVTLGISSEFGLQRVLNTPISESAIVGCAIGSAIEGLRPVAEIMYLDFLTTCMDMVVNQAAKIHYMSGGEVKVPLVIRTQGGAGRQAAAQHSQSLEAWFMHVPGLKVVMPSNPYDAKGLLKSAIRDDNPVLFIENCQLYNVKGEVPEDDYTVPIGKANIVKPGRDVTIVANWRMVNLSLEAANTLAKEGIDVEVIDLRSVSPLDKETIINSVKKTSRAVIVNEAVEVGNIANEIAAVILKGAFYNLDSPIQFVTSKYSPIPFAPILEREIIPNVQHIITAVRKTLE